MIQSDLMIFEIIRASLWGGEIPEIDSFTYNELREQAVLSLAACSSPNLKGLKYKQAARFFRMIAAQDEVINILQKNNIQTVVIKGTAAGIIMSP